MGLLYFVVLFWDIEGTISWLILYTRKQVYKGGGAVKKVQKSVYMVYEHTRYYLQISRYLKFGYDIVF